VQDSARQVTANITERAQRVASEARDADDVYNESTQTIAQDWQAVRASSATSVEALSEVRTAWTEWFGKATRLNAELAAVHAVPEREAGGGAPKGVRTTAMRNWMEASTKVLETAQHTSKQALRPLDERLNEAA
jgi:hypothetical protein